MHFKIPSRRQLALLIVLACTACDDCEDELDLINNVLDVFPGSVTLRVGERTQVQAVTVRPNLVPRVTSLNPTVAVGSVVSSGMGNSSNRAFIEITGLQPGTTTLEIVGAGDPAGTRPKTVDVTVVPAEVRVMLAPSSLMLMVGQTGRLECTVTRNGVVDAGAGVRYVSSNTVVADVASDGTVTALQAGTSQIACFLDTGEEAVALVTVVEPPTPTVPTPTQLSGSYSLAGTKQADSCPAGAFPAMIANSGISIDVVTTGENPTVVIRSNASINGIFNSQTGEYEGSGSTTAVIGGVPYNVTEAVNGRFTVITDSSTGQSEVRLMGTLTYLLSSSSAGSCTVTYDVFYSKSL